MLLNRLKWAGPALLAACAATWVLIQDRVITQLRGQESLLREEVYRLAGENEVLSNRLAQAASFPATAEAPPRELLRLRGEVGVLRRQLQESQSLMNEQSHPWPQTNSAAPGSSAAPRIERQAERTHLETILAKLRSPDVEWQDRAVILSASDDLLKSMLKELESAERRLAALQQGRSPVEASIEATREEVADLNAQISRRMEGALVGMQAKLQALNQEESTPGVNPP